MRQEYLQAVAGRIKDKTARRQILEELESHLLDKIDYYTEIGYPPEEAEKRAVEEMGDPDDTALPLRELHSKDNSPALRIIAILFCCLAGIVELFVPAFAYSGTYSMSWFGFINRSGSTHFLLLDLLSFAIVGGFVAILIRAYKRKSKSVTIIIMVFLAVTALSELFFGNLQQLLQQIMPDQYEGIIYTLAMIPGVNNLLVEWTPFAIFQPFLYAALKIPSSGFGGYADSLFKSISFDVQSKEFLKYGSLIVAAVLLIWAIVQLILIISQTLMKPTKLGHRIMKWFIRVVCVLLALYLAIISVCSVAAAFSFSGNKANEAEERTEMIEFVLNCTPLDFEATREELLAGGYREYVPEADAFWETERYFYKKEPNNLIVLDSFQTKVSFRTTQSTQQLSSEEVDLLDGTDVKTFGDFLALGLLSKTKEISHEIYHSYEEKSYIETITCTFPDNSILEGTTFCSFTAEYPSIEERPELKDLEFETFFPFGM